MKRIVRLEAKGQELDEEARLFKEEGIVKQIWEPVGTNIVYKRSLFERGGWSVPMSANIDEEEDVGAE